MREWSPAARMAVQLLVSLAIGLVVAFIGPFGTYTDMPAIDRYLYWAIIVPLNWAQIAVLTTVFDTVPRLKPWPRPALLAAVCVVASVPASFEVMALEQWLRPKEDAIKAWQLYPYVLALSLIITLPFKQYIGSYGQRADDAPETEVADAPPADTQPKILRRLPAHIGQELLCVEAEDHYLRVHTAGGSDLILYRMSDALEDLDGRDGLRVHRSFWVARDAIDGIDREGKRVSLRLSNGLVVPVSRTYLPGVRAAGWLDRDRRPSAQSTRAEEA